LPGGVGRPGGRGFAAAAAVLVGAAVVVLFWGALFGGRTFYERDLSTYSRANKGLIAPLSSASAGVPLWNPYYASGQPFAANPAHMVHHPLSRLFLFLPFEVAFRAQVLVPIGLALAGMFALLRALGRSQAGALFGALGWGLGGYLLSVTNALPILIAVSVCPLVLLFVVRLTRTGRLVDVAGLGLAYALVAFAAEPSTLFMAPVLSLPVILGRPASERRRAAALVVAGLALGVALAAIVLLPGAHHASKTIRAAGLPPRMADEWSMPPVRLAELFAANVLGHVNRNDEALFWGRALYGTKIYPLVYSLYSGLVLGLLALAALVKQRRRLWPWAAVAAVGFVAALGTHTPLWGAMRNLPGLAGLRYPEKFVLLMVLPVVIAATYGFDQVVHGPARGRRWITRALVAFAALGTLLAAGILAGGRLAGLDGSPGTFPVSVAARDAFRVSLSALGPLAIFSLWRRWPRRGAALLLCMVLAVDLVWAGRALVPTTSVSRLTTPPDFLRPIIQRRRDDVLFHLAAWDPEFGIKGGLARPPIPAQWGIATTLETDFDLTHLRWTTDGNDLFWKAIEGDPRLLEHLIRRRGATALVRFHKGVRWVGNRMALPEGVTSAVELSFAPDVPLAFAVSRVELVDGNDGWLKTVMRLGAEMATTACVDRAELGAFAGPPAPADVQIAERTPVRLVLDVNGRGPAASFIAINQTWDEGWRATLDQQPVRLIRTDVALSGLVVSPGRHRVELTYSDPWIGAGAMLSAAAALVCLALVLVGRRRERVARGKLAL